MRQMATARSTHPIASTTTAMTRIANPAASPEDKPGADSFDSSVAPLVAVVVPVVVISAAVVVMGSDTVIVVVVSVMKGI